MAIPQQFLDELVERCDIVEIISSYVTLKKQGSGYIGLCPFHSEKTPSFHVHQSRRFFHCFGCGAGGGVIQFIMRAENLPFPEAVRKLAGMVGMTVPEDASDIAARRLRERQLTLTRDAARFFHKTLTSPAGAAALAYLRRRGLSDNTIRRFGLGFAPDAWDSLLSEMLRMGYEKSEMLSVGLLSEGKGGHLYDRFRNRVMFPILSLRGDVIGFGGRVMDDSQPKYLNSPETSIFSKGRNLFALNLAKGEKADEYLLAEGYMDVIALHQAGFRTAVASLGTALTPDQARLLHHYTDKVVLVYDADSAGQKATERGIDILKAAGLNVQILRIPDGKDPDEFIRKNGSEAFESLLRGTLGDLEYRLGKLPGADALNISEQKVIYLKAAAILLASVENPVERDVYIHRVAQQTDTTVDALRIQIKQEMTAKTRQTRREETRKVLSPERMVQPAVRSLHYDNPRAARAEEEIIAALFHDPALLHCINVPQVLGQFTVPLYRKLLGAIAERFQEGGSIGLDSLGDYLDAEEASQIAKLLQERSISGAEQAIRDSLEILRQESTKDSSLQALIDAKKDFEGF